MTTNIPFSYQYYKEEEGDLVEERPAVADFCLQSTDDNCVKRKALAARESERKVLAFQILC